MSIPKQGELWKHYKTKGVYEIVSTGRLQVKDTTLDMEECVIYRDCDGGHVWVRPLEDFTEILTISGERIPRFEKIEK